MRAVADMGGWAWYQFAGFLRQGNKEALHITSSNFNEPTLMGLLPRAEFVVAFHGSSEAAGEPLVYVGGRWKLGRQKLTEAINATVREHGISAVDAIDDVAPEQLRGVEVSNITNRGKRLERVQFEFSR
jgi:phage replication-related protein YjqB (UPF0714/DUF867 family)